MTPTIYGIINCDTIRKARAWLNDAGIAHHFHDYRVEGVDPAKLRAWVALHGWEKLLNRAGTTFRALPPEAKEGLDEGRAIDLMLANPTLIKRPVLEAGEQVLVGFKADEYRDRLV